MRDPERRCQCAAKWSHGRETVTDGGQIILGPPGPCPAEMTGEDLLCNMCRLRAVNQSKATAPVPDPCGYRVTADA